MFANGWVWEEGVSEDLSHLSCSLLGQIMVLQGTLCPQPSLFQGEPSCLLPKIADREGVGVGDFSLSCLSGSFNVVLSSGCSGAAPGQR